MFLVLIYILQTAHLWANTEWLRESGPSLGYNVESTTRDQRLLVSHPKDTEIQVSNVESQGFHLKYK